jgi:uncharacterized membrane protein YhhN
MNQPEATIKNGWQIGYLALLGTHLFAIFFNWEICRFVTKPLLMALLIVYFLSVTHSNSPARISALAALFFSWLGDVFLMQQEPGFFIAGLSSFLLAQLVYSWIFLQARKRQNKNGHWNLIILVITLAYVAILYAWLYSYLPKDLQLPVLLYALAIGWMLITAFHATAKPFAYPAVLLLSGAILFVLSDSMLAINQFIQPFPLAGVGIMLTYGLAQLFIVQSISRIT